MKTNVSSLGSLTLASLLAFTAGVGPSAAQTLVDLDPQPAFDFGDNPFADPFFAPATLGLTNGAPGFAQASDLATLAAAAKDAFPQSHEVFLAYWGNPRYALLTNWATAGANRLNVAMSFQNPRRASGIAHGRGYGGYSDPLDVRLDGVTYELLDTLYVSPLVLDLDGDGVLSGSRGLWQPHPARLTGPYAAFDMEGDGFKDITEWIGAGDALLTTSTNPTSGLDLLGTAGGWRDGFAQLAARFDRDCNGDIEGTERNGLYLWRDGNSNATADAGEVVSLDGLVLRVIGVDHPTDSTARFESLASPGTTGMVWDWWPNYARVNRKPATPGGGGTPKGTVSRMIGVNNSTHVPDPTNGLLHASWHVTLGEIGADPASFGLALLSGNGRVLIGCDQAGTPRRARLLQIRQDTPAPQVRICPLPFVEVFQLACDPAGEHVLVLGDHGSKLAYVDLPNQRVEPEHGFELRRVGLRASGVAGCTGGYWFTAWEVDAEGVTGEERVWALTPKGWLLPGLSLDALRTEVGPLRSHYLTGPTSGFFTTVGPGGTNEILWHVPANSSTSRVAIAQADAFGGLAATGDKVVYTKRIGTSFVTEYWWDLDGTPWVFEDSSHPGFYPFLTDGGGTVVDAWLSPASGTITYRAATNVTSSGGSSGPGFTLLTTHPGQGKTSRGAFAHHGTNGIDILPMPDAPAPAPRSQVWRYSLLPASYLINECPLCVGPTIPEPLHGTFDLRLIQESPLFAQYAVVNLSFTAGFTAGRTYKVTGKGDYLIGGEVGLFQDLSLEVQIDDGITNQLCYLTNATFTVDRLWPMLEATVVQTNGTFTQVYHLHLCAAPLREIWFSTANGLTPGVPLPEGKYVSAGDLVSSTGRIVKRNQELTTRLGIMPMVPDLGLDAVDVLPGGEIAFSMEQAIFSESLGPLHPGDVLSDRGRIVADYASLLGAFSPEPPPADQGLDALQVSTNGEILFSIASDFFSESLGRVIRKGDLLSSRGVVVKSNEQLVARFTPADPKQDYGLDALHVWPSGEVWFSVETGFYGPHFEPYGRGDLLSDQGYVVYRNLDLVAPFQPLEDLADFGLDALFIVSDVGAPAPAVPAPLCTGISVEGGSGNIQLEWTAPGRVFQLERATNIAGPWQPASPILSEPPKLDSNAFANSPQGFYRLRQW